MSLPNPDLQRSFFDTDVFLKRLFDRAPEDRFAFFAEHVRPQLVCLRPQLAAMYCPDNGRPAEEPVRLPGVLILQYMERLPDRQAAEACTYDLRWKLALGMEADETAFHPTSLVYFRRRRLEHGLAATAFDAGLDAMRKAGYLKARKAQRLDSTHVLGLVSEMSRLECVRESLRLALEREPALARPSGWPVWWERYVESRPDYQAPRDALAVKMTQAGQDARELIDWTNARPEALRSAREIETLRRVFVEHFELAPELQTRPAQPSGSVHNPHDPEAQWSSKSTIAAKAKSWVGYKAQVAETAPSADDSPRAPTDAVITAGVTQPAISSDKAALPIVEQEWTRTNQATPEFKVRMHPRNGIEGSIGELKRGYGLGRSRYRGLEKTTLQNYLIAAACNLKRWARRAAWEILQGEPAGCGPTPAWAA